MTICMNLNSISMLQWPIAILIHELRNYFYDLHVILKLPQIPGSRLPMWYIYIYFSICVLALNKTGTSLVIHITSIYG